jgi:hypothetical protein
MFFATGAIYLILMLPLFYITPIFGVGEHVGNWPANGFLSNFEIAWQPICAVFYFLAFAKIIAPRKIFAGKSTKIFANLPLIASLIEALVLNIYQIVGTRISRNFVDGIFTANSEYSIFSAVIYISFTLVAIAFVNHYFDGDEPLDISRKTGKLKK